VTTVAPLGPAYAGSRVGDRPLGTLRRVHRLHQLGWSLFIVSALLFIWAGARSGDWLVVSASVVFGLACVLFLVATDDVDGDGPS
jgi:hypothetical protein